MKCVYLVRIKVLVDMFVSSHLHIRFSVYCKKAMHGWCRPYCKEAVVQVVL
jgi:hypothetical protein